MAAEPLSVWYRRSSDVIASRSCGLRRETPELLLEERKALARLAEHLEQLQRLSSSRPGAGACSPSSSNENSAPASAGGRLLVRSWAKENSGRRIEAGAAGAAGGAGSSLNANSRGGSPSAIASRASSQRAIRSRNSSATSHARRRRARARARACARGPARPRCRLLRASGWMPGAPLDLVDRILAHPLRIALGALSAIERADTRACSAPKIACRRGSPPRSRECPPPGRSRRAPRGDEQRLARLLDAAVLAAMSAANDSRTSSIEKVSFGADSVHLELVDALLQPLGHPAQLAGRAQRLGGPRLRSGARSRGDLLDGARDPRGAARPWRSR